MPRVCAICRHPQRDAIDQALVTAGALGDIAARYRVREAALRHHRAEHLQAEFAQGLVTQLHAVHAAAQARLAALRTRKRGGQDG